MNSLQVTASPLEQWQLPHGVAVTSSKLQVFSQSALQLHMTAGNKGTSTGTLTSALTHGQWQTYSVHLLALSHKVYTRVYTGCLQARSQEMSDTGCLQQTIQREEKRLSQDLDLETAMEYSVHVREPVIAIDFAPFFPPPIFMAGH